MKKALSLILALVLCLSLCACGEGTQPSAPPPTPPPEIISVDTLFVDVTNGAKCTLNIGKQVTVLGQIHDISADSCRIQLVSHPDKNVHIRLPIEMLAELSIDSFIAVTGIVEAYKEHDWSWYTISATEPLDENETDAIFREIVRDKYSYSKCYSSYHFKNAIYILCDYMTQRSSLYTTANSEELQEYLCGTWDCGYYKNSLQESSFTWLDITYNEDGSVKYSTENSWSDDWSVGDYGSLQSFFGKKAVYVLSDDVFICDGYVFVRQYPICFRTITLSDKDTANYVLKLWQDGEATDNSMKELMDEYGADQGGGQLYEFYTIDADMFLDDIAAWCLHYSRREGDAEVISTDYGYAIVYIVSLNNG